MGFIREGATVNKHRYKEILHHLRNSILSQRPDLWPLLHKNIPSYSSVLVEEELAKQQVTVLPRLHTNLNSLYGISFSLPSWK
jgi:hypothetical protein